MTRPVVLVTGALAGIGRATAFAFVREGADVVISGRDAAAGAALQAELAAPGANVAFVRADVRSEDDVRGLVEHTVERFGRLDVAVNNAGVEGAIGPVTEQAAGNYEAVFHTNVLGTLLGLKHEMRVMLRQGSGSIINLSSVAGQVGMAGASVYAASKLAVDGLTRTAALEGAAAGVRVNAVAPGPVATAMFHRFTGGTDEAKAQVAASVPLGRAALPEDIAETIVFLGSDKARYVTGHTLTVDGGYTAQ